RNAGPFGGLGFVTDPASRDCSREGRDGHRWRGFPFGPGSGNFVRLTSASFGCDSRKRRIAAFHAFLRWDVRGNSMVWGCSLRSISLNAYQVFPSLAAAVPGSPGELIETPLDAQL